MMIFGMEWLNEILREIFLPPLTEGFKHELRPFDEETVS
jgi:hypothetical protein